MTTQKTQNRIAIYVDGPNFYWTMKELGKRLDFKELLMLLGQAQIDGLILKFFYDTNTYGTIKDNPLLNYLEEMGFEIVNVVRKSYDVTHTNKSPKSRTDQMLTVHLMKDLLNNQFDRLILFSGDSDFEFVIHECIKARKHVTVISSGKNLSRQLKDAVNDVILFETIKPGSKLWYAGK